MTSRRELLIAAAGAGLLRAARTGTGEFPYAEFEARIVAAV